VELTVFLVPDCPHLLADHLFGMGDAPGLIHRRPDKNDTLGVLSV
jgi:hypothetical protein